MADTLGMAELRGIDINKLAKGYADQPFIFRKLLNVSSTKNREIRWYKKTSGVLTGVTTTGITSSPIKNAFGTLPPVTEQSATRMTSYIQHFSVESPWISYADIRDCDLDMISINVRDLTRAVQNQEDYRIFDVMSGSLPLSGSAAADWGTFGSCNPIRDLLSGATQIELQNYSTANLVVLMNPTQKQQMLDWIINTKGSSVPSFSSRKVEDGVLMEIVGQRVIVSNNVTAGFVMQVVPKIVGTWKEFEPISAVKKEEPGIGVKIRVWEDGEVIITDPYAAFLTKGA